MSPRYISHDPTIEEAIGAVTHVLQRFQQTATSDVPSEAEAAYRGAALELIELIADAVEQRIARRRAAQDVLTVTRELTHEQQPLVTYPSRNVS